MKVATLVVLLLVGVFAAFVAANWSAVTAPTALTVLFDTVQFPLGLVLLAFTALIVSSFLVLLLVQQTGVILAGRRAAREVSAQRARADVAEASRLTDLHQHLDEELHRIEERATSRHAALSQRLGELASELHAHLEQTGNTVAAQVGEMDDRIERLCAARMEPRRVA